MKACQHENEFGGLQIHAGLITQDTQKMHFREPFGISKKEFIFAFNCLAQDNIGWQSKKAATPKKLQQSYC